MSTYIRILPKKQFFISLGRFSSAAFKNYKGSISIIQRKCIKDTGTTICIHLRKFYQSVDEPPHILWLFDREILPKNCEIQQKDSLQGDKCHYEIIGLSDNKAKRILNNHLQSLYDSVFICDNKDPRKFCQSDMKILEQFGVTS